MPTEYIKTPSDLVTSHSAIVEGFLKQALAKTEKANPYSEAATAFHQALQSVQDLDSLGLLLDDPAYRGGLIAAAGFSKKATNYASKEELDSAILSVFPTLKDTVGEAFREELVYRYLLTMGDTLGGSMRNYVGASAKRVLSDAIHAVLTDVMQPKISEEGVIQGFTWDDRLLLFDITPTLIGKNVDAILFDTSGINSAISLAKCYLDIIEERTNHLRLMSKQPNEARAIRSARRAVIAIERQTDSLEREIKSNPPFYLAAGELKGGIDPAGADEHWKTARSALDRINQKFADQDEKPKLFYVAAAIQGAQADEIYARLQDGSLAYAANLTVPEQVQDLAEWLVKL